MTPVEVLLNDTIGDNSPMCHWAKKRLMMIDFWDNNNNNNNNFI